MHCVKRAAVILAVSITSMVDGFDDKSSSALRSRVTISLEKQYDCIGKKDTLERFELEGYTTKKSCEWVRRNITAQRCKIPMVNIYCPITCGVCPTIFEPSPSPTDLGIINEPELISSQYYGDKDGHKISKDESNDSLILVVSTVLGGFALMIGVIALVIRKRKRFDIRSITDDGDLTTSSDPTSTIQVVDIYHPQHKTRQAILNSEEVHNETAVVSIQSSNSSGEQHRNHVLDHDHKEIDIQSLSYDSVTLSECHQSSSTFSGKMSVWSRRIERDSSYDTESKITVLSDFVLPSVYETSCYSGENGSYST